MTMARVGIADITAADTTKHVRYTFGMVLGVDDFTQEFAYLSARDRWLARDLVGYGTVWGLAVEAGPDAEARPRVTVDRGVGLTPLGELVCVPAMQCAYLAPWLRTNAEKVAQFQPDDGLLTLYVVLCYRHRETDEVPIPGEPCRTEDELTAASRIADDFVLELRTVPPAQSEDDAIRDFVAWLREVPVVDGVGSGLKAFEDEIRAAALPAPAGGTPTCGSPPDSTPGSPPASPPAPERCEAMLHPPTAGIEIPADELADYVRAAFRIWTTEIRPRWRLDVGCGSECDPPADAGCLLLAELGVSIAWDSGTPIPTTDPIDVRDGDRPFLVSQRMLEEWGFAGVGAAETGSPPAGSPPGGSALPAIVAAGSVGADGAVPPQHRFGDLLVTQLSADTTSPVPGGYRLSFTGFHDGGSYVVTGTPVRTLGAAARSFEMLDAGVVSGLGHVPGAGVYVRLFNTGNGTGNDAPFHVQVLELPGGAP